MSIEDELIDEYQQKLADIYDRRTAGDYTFTGILAQFLWDLEKAKNAGETPGTHVFYPSGHYILERTEGLKMYRLEPRPFGMEVLFEVSSDEEEIQSIVKSQPNFNYFFSEELD